MKIKLTECPICNGTKFKDLDYLREQKYWYDRDYLYKDPVGFKICETCAFVTYDYETDAELKRRYDALVPVVTANSLITKNRKLEYHKKFLDEFMPCGNVLDYGCATGYFLDYIWKSGCVVAQLSFNTGVEFSKLLSDYALYEYNIEVKDHIPDKEYDLICCYHTLEHVQYPDKLLTEFRNHLANEGNLYLAIPHWFNGELDEASGSQCVEFEELYHVNHVNVFSENDLQNLLKKVGFKIIKEDRKLYGYTVLCEKAEPKELTSGNYANCGTIVKDLENQKKAMELFKQGNHHEALEYYKNYPDAWIHHAIKDFKDLEKQKDTLLQAMDATDGAYKIKRQLAHLYFTWNQNNAGEKRLTNHIKNAKQLFEELIEEKPGMEDFYYYLAMIEKDYYQNYEKARELYETILKINPAKYVEIHNLIGELWKVKGENG
ncbi:MAG: methyltransferase domain-containing protein [PVC group bacterium]|nr:methyltransferase domain-containing protein [PVC group bacterium]